MNSDDDFENRSTKEHKKWKRDWSNPVYFETFAAFSIEKENP